MAASAVAPSKPRAATRRARSFEQLGQKVSFELPDAAQDLDSQGADHLSEQRSEAVHRAEPCTRQGCEAVPFGDQAQDGRGLELGVIHSPFLDER